MHTLLKDKVALVTGAGSGIGKAAAVRFAREGAKVGLLGHTADELQAAVDEINRSAEVREAGGQAIALVADVGDVEQTRGAVAQTTTRFGGLDILFANAGINGVWAPVEEITPEEWHRTIHTNLTGTFYSIHCAVPHLKRRGKGAILITASINGTRVFSNTGATAYSCTKAAQVAMAQMLALELARFNIRVNVICPGAVDTEINDNTEKRDLNKIEVKAKYETNVPLSGKPASAEQVSDLALFLVSEASSHITGTPVWIDGAQSLLKG